MTRARPLWLLPLLITLGCGGARAAWREAAAEDSFDAYRRYALDHPRSGRVEEAEKRAHDLLWAHVTEQDTSAGYRRYTTAHPDGAHLHQAKRLAERREIEEAVAAGRPQLVAQLIRQYDGASHLDDVEATLELAHWREAARVDSPEAYQAYLARYPNGTFRREAAATQQIAAFETVRLDDDPGAYRAFIQAHPRSPYVREARERLAQLAFRAMNVVVLVHTDASFEPIADDVREAFQGILRASLRRHGVTAELEVLHAARISSTAHPYEVLGYDPDRALLVVDMVDASAVSQSRGWRVESNAGRVRLYAPGRRAPVLEEPFIVEPPEEASPSERRRAVAQAVAGVRMPLADYRR